MKMAFANFPYLSCILFSCVIGLLIILFLPERRKQEIKWVSCGFFRNSAGPVAVSVFGL
jgi:NADH-quinone oxidoreductase subunit M